MRGAGRRPALAAGGLAAVASLVGGCSIGAGSGSAVGTLWAVDCDSGNSYAVNGQVATAAAPLAFDLSPTFFAGEPLEDLSQGPTYQNRLFIRIQRSGQQLQYEDVLYFDVENSYEVARCLRGRTVNGQPDWKTTEPLAANTVVSGETNGSTVWCDWSGAAFGDAGSADGAADAGRPLDAGASLDGGMSVMAEAPRIRITTDTDVQSTLLLGGTCAQANLAGIGVDGWIQFMSFGGAEEPNLPPEERDPVSPDFVINFGDRLHATFYVVIDDDRTVAAHQLNQPPVAPMMGATLGGYFDFELERGRAAQPFP